MNMDCKPIFEADMLETWPKRDELEFEVYFGSTLMFTTSDPSLAKEYAHTYLEKGAMAHIVRVIKVRSLAMKVYKRD